MKTTRISLLAVLSAGLFGCRKEAPPAPPAPAPVAVATPDAAAVDPVVAKAQPILAKAFEVMRCFVADMRDLREKDPRFAEYERNPFTETFAFHAVFDDPKQLERDQAALCKAVSEKYQRLFLATISKRKPPARGAILPVPPPTVDSLPEFIRAGGGAMGLHILEHEELTVQALIEATGGKPRPNFAIAGFGARMSDISRWGDVRYHAQTEDHDPSMRESENPTGQEAFVGRVIVALGSFVTAAREEKYSRAAVWLGIACHSVQDLAYHHGITRQQLSGLRYLLRTDPEGPSATAAHADAKRWTKDIIALAKDTLQDEVRWQRFVTANPSGYNRADVLKMLFKDEPAIPAFEFTNLAGHWAQHLVYEVKPETRAELREGPLGILRWNAQELIERVHRGLANSGLALRRTR